ncbi:MAG: hypothetical protein AB1742_12120 [bacterium]
MFRAGKLQLCALLFSILLCAPVSAEQVTLYTADDADAPVKHGAAYLARVLVSAGHEVTAATSPPPVGGARTVIYVGDATRDAATAALLEDSGAALPDEAESFAVGTVKKEGATLIAGAGSDAVGAMYAAYEIAERIEMNPAAPLERAAQTGVFNPFVKIRAVNPFFHTQAFEDAGSWYYDVDFWADYLDLLSRSRYNLLDVHAMYDIVTTRFPNAYLYLLRSGEFPEVGIPSGKADLNLKMFNRIIAMAKERGIRTSLMSYHASWSLTAREEDAPRRPSDEELAAYTREMVRRIIGDCPDLWMIGFRIGESGRSEEFFRRSYIAGIKDAARPVNMFTRTWLAAPDYVREIADAYPGRTYIEIKYNGEHLGLPYHAITSPYKTSAPSYSYENYTNYPRNYKIVWQIRANGTHRLFRWGDPLFAARTARSLRFGDGHGFTMEPFTSYYPMTNYIFRKDSGLDFFKWDHERNWFWYFVWGRTAYDPETREEVWLLEFGKRFGAAAPNVLSALTAASRIVPLIYSYRCLGLDHRQMAPEYETGGTLDDFTRNLPLDINVMRPIDEYVRHYLFRSPFLNAKMSPYEAADLLDEYANRAAEETAAAERTIRQSGARNPEFESLRAEIETLKHLAAYYSNKTRAAAALAFFRETGDLNDLFLAKELAGTAIGAWELLAEAGDRYFQPLIDTLRMHTTGFTWRTEGEKLAEDMKILAEEEKRFSETAGDGLRIFHRPVFYWRASGEPVPITATVTGGEPVKASLFYREKGAKDFTEIPLAEAVNPQTYAAQIPPMNRDAALEYYIEAVSGGGKAVFPGGKPYAGTAKPGFEISDYADGSAKNIQRELEKMNRVAREKYVRLIVTSDDSPPEIGQLQARVLDGGGKAAITTRVKDDSGVESVVLYYKLIPSQYLWYHTEMKKTDADLYSAEVLLTHEGLLYYVAAADTRGNAAMYPDFRLETPYRALPGWDPAENPHR